MTTPVTIDQSSPLWFVQSCTDCNNDFVADENNLFGCNTYVQYTLTCSKCKESIIYQEKGQAIMDKVFHERFARHKVSLKEEILAIREGLELMQLAENNPNEKMVSILLHPQLYEVVERLAYIYDQTVEQYIHFALEQQVNGDIANHPDEIGNKACAKLKTVLESAGINTW